VVSGEMGGLMMMVLVAAVGLVDKEVDGLFTEQRELKEGMGKFWDGNCNALQLNSEVTLC
jgi:hypothetical protein